MKKDYEQNLIKSKEVLIRDKSNIENLNINKAELISEKSHPQKSRFIL